MFIRTTEFPFFSATGCSAVMFRRSHTGGKPAGCAAAFVLCAVLLGVAGCGTNPAPVNTEVAEQSGETALEQAEKCRKRMDTAISRVSPLEVSVEGRTTGAVSAMNAWLGSCAADDLMQISTSEATEAMLTDEERRLASSRRFTDSDARWVRNCLLFRSLAERLLAESDRDDSSLENREVRRIRRVLNWVCRHVALMPREEERVPLDVFEVLLTGRGSYADRQWIFAEVMRQLQLDAFVLEPTDPAADSGTSLLDTAPGLVGVCVEDRALFFDCESGFPVSSETGAEFPANAVNAETVAAHPRWSRSVPQVVVQAAAVSPRMLVLQSNLPASNGAMLFEELAGGTSEITPLITRVEKATGAVWKAADTAVWQYPGLQLAAAASLSEDQQFARRLIMTAFDAPFESEIVSPKEDMLDMNRLPEEMSEAEKEQRLQAQLEEQFERMSQSTEAMFGKPSKRLLKTRIEQISGSSDLDVIQQYQQVRLSGVATTVALRLPDRIKQQLGIPPQNDVIEIPLPESVVNTNIGAIVDATYWTGLCQADRDQHGAAILALAAYQRQLPDGKWMFPALNLQAEMEIARGNADAARQLLMQADQPENPERRRTQLLLAGLVTSDAPDAPAADAASEGDPAEATQPAPGETDSDEAGSDEAATDTADAAAEDK